MKLKPNQGLLVIGLVVVLIGSVWLIPYLLSLYLQARGGQLLNQVQSNISGRTRESFTCSLPPVRDTQNRTMLTNAVSNLRSALDYDSNASQAHLLLGRTYCLLGDAESAVSSYLAFNELRPNNPLGYLELGFAYEALCIARNGAGSRTTGDKLEDALCKDSALQSLIVEAWRKSEVVTGQLIEEGNRAFSRQNYETAFRWFQRGAIFGGKLPFLTSFKWGVSAVLAGYSIPEGFDPSIITIHPIGEKTQIEAETLQWLYEDLNWNVNYGDKLIDHPSTDPTVGVMWWAGAAVAFVQVPEEAIYKITIRAQDSPPGNFRLQLEKNLVPIEIFVLAQGDQSWQELEAATLMQAGTHLIGIRFLEDNGDAVLDWIRFEKIH